MLLLLACLESIEISVCVGLCLHQIWKNFWLLFVEIYFHTPFLLLWGLQGTMKSLSQKLWKDHWCLCIFYTSDIVVFTLANSWSHLTFSCCSDISSLYFLMSNIFKTQTNYIFWVTIFFPNSVANLVPVNISGQQVEIPSGFF